MSNMRGKLVAAAILVLASIAGTTWAEKIPFPGPRDPRVGDWIELRSIHAELNLTSTSRQTITAVSRDDFTVLSEGTSVVNGQSLGSSKEPPQTYPRMTERTAAAAALKRSTQTIRAADGKEYECLVIEARMFGKLHKTYLCDGVPMGGPIRAEVDGKLAMEMTGWGRGR